MSLMCLVIVGKDNEPLYQRDFSPCDACTDGEDDCFGFGSSLASDTISLRHEFMMHAALDYVDELDTNKWKKRNTKWIGKLCPMEETVIYAYVTPTNVKMLAMVQDPVRESDLKLFFNKLHELFIQYTLNPFTKLREPIVSNRFDESVSDAVETYNEITSTKQRKE